MGVDRAIKMRVVTNLQYFSEIIEVLTNDYFAFNKDGTITSLAEDDIDDYNFIQYSMFSTVKGILDKREDKGLGNYIVIWAKNIDDSLLVSSRKMDTTYKGYKNQYEITFSMGSGIRIKGAERYTDFGIYLNELLPLLVKESMYVCEINCTDSDC